MSRTAWIRVDTSLSRQLRTESYIYNHNSNFLSSVISDSGSNMISVVRILVTEEVLRTFSFVFYTRVLMFEKSVATWTKKYTSFMLKILTDVMHYKRNIVLFKIEVPYIYVIAVFYSKLCRRIFSKKYTHEMKDSSEKYFL